LTVTSTAKSPGSPAVAVVVPTRDRPLHLRWLLDALCEQEVAPAEVVVVDDASREPPDVTDLAGRLPLRVLRRDTPGGPGAARNDGWRATSAPLVAFTDDDCRPAPGWIAALAAAAAREPGAVLVGETRPDPDAVGVLHAAPYARTQEHAADDPFGPACNVAYPRTLLERTGGFDPALGWGGEDTELFLRATATAPAAPVPSALVHHAVHDDGLLKTVRRAWAWRDLAAVPARHPRIRGQLFARTFWRPSHAALLATAVTHLIPLGAPRLTRAAALAALAATGAPRYGTSPRALARSLTELPGHVLITAAETAAALTGSARHGTLFL
jgi:glycosyltransferase involved in cell wall biosynthesis